MIGLACVALATIVACEIGLRLPLTRVLGALTNTAHKSVAVVRSARISEHWKEKVLLTYSMRILGASFGLMLCLISVALPVLIAATFWTGSFSTGSAYLMRPVPLAVMMLIGVIWIWARKRLTL